MSELIEFLNGFNIQTIVSMAVIMWYFTRELKISLETKIDNLDKDMRLLNTRISILEGTVYGKGVYNSKE